MIKSIVSLIFLCLGLALQAQTQVELKGYFFVENFKNKINKTTKIKEYYFRSGGQYYFVKNCESLFKVSPMEHLQKAMIKATLQEGLLDICDKNTLAQSRVGPYITIENVLTDKNFNFTICDQNGNCLVLKNDTLSYLPVAVEQSSSGIYSGGIERIEKIEYNDRIRLIRTFQKTFTKFDKSVFDKRRKGEIFIQFSTLNGDKMLASKEIKRWQKFIKNAF